MSVRGSFKALSALANAMQQLPEKMRSQTGKVLGMEAIKLVADGFNREQDPYGVAWAPLKHRQGKILRKTSRLRNSFYPRTGATQLGFTISSTVKYAKFHQQGTVGRKGRALEQGFQGARREGIGVIPRRMMIPSGTLGSIWSAALNNKAALLMKKWVNGRG